MEGLKNYSGFEKLMGLIKGGKKPISENGELLTTMAG